jgi:hypothetical protein
MGGRKGRSVRLTSKTDKAERLTKANQMLVIISAHGRHFFKHENKVSSFIFKKGQLFFVDCYTQKSIYVAYKGRWNSFSEGGTLRSLVEALANYIKHDDKPPLDHLGPWPKWICGGDLWGYGEDMAQVQRECNELFEVDGRS